MALQISNRQAVSAISLPIMKQNRAAKPNWWVIATLFILCLLIKLFSLHSNLVEEYYSNRFYKGISHALRLLFGWLPFSFGDVLYAAAVVYLLYAAFRIVWFIFRKKFQQRYLVWGLYKFLLILLVVYATFNLFWGLNYDRNGIAYQLALEPENESVQDLQLLTDSLLVKVNATRKALPQNVTYLSYSQTCNEAIMAYQKAKIIYPFLWYTTPSVKASFYGLLGNYLGFSGYYNPFSGEAQVNKRVPPFLIPYVTCHEMAHQIGYATEDEANFAGYLSAKSSGNPEFQYSVYFDLFNYANSELFLVDSVAAKSNYQKLDTLVKTDLKTYRHFLHAYRNPLEPIITKLYGNYLKANNQPQGIETYSRVIGWMIAYQKKYKRL